MPKPSPDSLISVQSVSFGYGREPILRNVSLEVERGDFLALIGPNGGGKSTLLRLILGVLTPTQGSITCKAKAIGYVPQNTNINTAFPITALDVVGMGVVGKERRTRSLEALRSVGMEALAQRRIGELSGGQRQRVMIARALVAKPEVLMLDEPTSSIDPQGQRDIYELLAKLGKAMTVVVVSHDIAVVVRYAKKVAYINRTLTFHDLSAMQRAYAAHGEHFCEVELLEGLHG